MNVQQTIIKGIRELLFFHNYLVLPHFGGFVLKTSPSHFSISGGQILPPGKTVSFNAQLKQNDGILAIWLQDQLPCEPAEALKHLHDFAEFCNSVLSARRRLSLDRIGFFYLDFENNICFEPQQDANFLTDSFGLGPVSVQECDPAPTEARRPAVFVDRKLHKEDVKLKAPSTAKNYRRLLIPAFVSILFFSLLLTFVSNSRFSGQLRASVFGNGTKHLYEPLPYPELALFGDGSKAITYVADANGIAMLELGNNKLLAVRALNHLNPAVKSRRPVFKNIRNKNFEIVLGCFTVLQNANRMVERLKGQKLTAELSNINEKGMYTVSNGSFATKEEALLRLKELKQDYPKAWIKMQRSP